MDCWKLGGSPASSASSSSTIGSLTAPFGGEVRMSLAADEDEDTDGAAAAGRETAAGDCDTCAAVDARDLSAELGAAT